MVRCHRGLGWLDIWGEREKRREKEIEGKETDLRWYGCELADEARPENFARGGD